MKRMPAIILTLGIVIFTIIIKRIAMLDLALPVIIATSLWMAIDSHNIQLRKYETNIPHAPFIVFCLGLGLWLVIFPMYLEARYKINKHLAQLRPPVEKAQLGKMKPLAYVGIMTGIIFFVFGFLAPVHNFRLRFISVMVGFASILASTRFRYVRGEEKLQERRLSFRYLFDHIALIILSIFVCFVAAILIIRFLFFPKGVQ